MKISEETRYLCTEYKKLLDELVKLRNYIDTCLMADTDDKASLCTISGINMDGRLHVICKDRAIVESIADGELDKQCSSETSTMYYLTICSAPCIWLEDIKEVQ